jgi:RecG-like helicase
VGQRVSVPRPCDDPVATTIAGVARRQRCEVSARVVSIRASQRPTVVLDVTVDDGTGTLLCTFFGRQEIPGLTVGRHVRVTGRLVRYRDRECLLNPAYELEGDAGDASATSS